MYRDFIVNNNRKIERAANNKERTKCSILFHAINWFRIYTHIGRVLKAPPHKMAIVRRLCFNEIANVAIDPPVKVFCKCECKCSKRVFRLYRIRIRFTEANTSMLQFRLILQMELLFEFANQTVFWCVETQTLWRTLFPSFSLSLDGLYHKIIKSHELYGYLIESTQNYLIESSHVRCI